MEPSPRESRRPAADPGVARVTMSDSTIDSSAARKGRTGEPAPAAAGPGTQAPPPPPEEPLVPGGPAFLAWVEMEAQTSVSSCYQCQKCSAGCPIAPWMDILPHQVVHRIRLGLKDEILASKTIWLCAACQTCLTRCPNGVDIPRFMEALRRRAQREGVEAGERNLSIFMGAFADTLRRKGRLHEVGLMRRYKMRTGDLFSDLKLGLRMWGRGKLRLFARKVKGIGEVRKLFEQAEQGP